MLLKVKLNNFKSFKNLTELDFNATNYKILNDTNGKPFLNYANSYISIAHENDYAIAYVLVEV